MNERIINRQYQDPTARSALTNIEDSTSLEPLDWSPKHWRALALHESRLRKQFSGQKGSKKKFQRELSRLKEAITSGQVDVLEFLDKPEVM